MRYIENKILSMNIKCSSNQEMQVILESRRCTWNDVVSGLQNKWETESQSHGLTTLQKARMDCNRGCLSHAPHLGVHGSLELHALDYNLWAFHISAGMPTFPQNILTFSTPISITSPRTLLSSLKLTRLSPTQPLPSAVVLLLTILSPKLPPLCVTPFFHVNLSFAKPLTGS